MAMSDAEVIAQYGEDAQTTEAPWIYFFVDEAEEAERAARYGVVCGSDCLACRACSTSDPAVFAAYLRRKHAEKANGTASLPPHEP
jgi:hypothetical protein